MIKGVPVSPGVAVAQAYCLNQALARREPIHLTPDALSAEVTRFDAACAAAGRELDAVVRRVTQQVGEDEASIFRAHQLLLRDPAFVGKVRAAVMDKRIDAAAAVQQTVEEYKALFSHITDKYIQERIADLRDVGGRILAQLARQENRPLLDVSEPVILIAPEILPSQAMTFDRKLVAGILTERGAATGHAAILARSLNIPAVSGLDGLTRQVKTGDLIALDGREGHVHLNPGPEVVGGLPQAAARVRRPGRPARRERRPAGRVARRRRRGAAGQRQRRRRRRARPAAAARPASACTAPNTCS